MSYTLRRAALADADALSALAGELFPDACPSFLPRSAIDAFIAENLSIEAFRGHLAHPSWRAWVTERSDQTVPSRTPGQRAVAPVAGVDEVSHRFRTLRAVWPRSSGSGQNLSVSQST